MDINNTGALAHNPFAVLTLIVAPAILTNAASVLGMSTSNRFLRTSERIREMAAELEEPLQTSLRKELLLRQLQRGESQALFLLNALRAIYIALGAFAGASLVSIIGALLATRFLPNPIGFQVFAMVGLAVGFVGVASLVWGCVNLSRATRLSMTNISEAAAFLRDKHRPRNPRAAPIGKPTPHQFTHA